MKRKLACALAALVTVSAFGVLTACGTGDDSKGGVAYTKVMSSQTKKAIGVDETVTYDVDKDLGGKEYLRLRLTTDVDLLGSFVYESVENRDTLITEEFFIEKSNGTDVVEFKQFLDSFRYNGVGQVAERNATGGFDSHIFEKTLKKITFTNKSEVAGNFQVENLSVADRVVPDFEREVYIEKDNLKVGADLGVGGTLTYLERTSYQRETVDEVITADGHVYIGVDAKSKEGAKHKSSHVNLINIYDQGRQFQQSYYANVGGTSADTHDKMVALGCYNGQMPPDYGANGYERGWCKTGDPEGDGYYWPYNPVQGGDVARNSSQIIDYEITDNQIYVKTRAMDWGKGDDGSHLPGTVVGGVTTKSYMENWYTITNGMLRVKNRFIDWNGFTDMENVPEHSNELPAAYVSHPLHNYVCYEGTMPWTNGELTYDGECTSWVRDAHRSYNPAEGWFAWVNDDDLEDLGGFGVGVYIPNTKVYVSGRCNTSTLANALGNKDAYSAPCATTYRFNKPAATYPQMSCYVGNTSYTAPVVSWKMRTYEAMEYEYAIAVDYVRIMREQFHELYESQTLLNKSWEKWLA